jgi:hypothetical protein
MDKSTKKTGLQDKLHTLLRLDMPLVSEYKVQNRTTLFSDTDGEDQWQSWYHLLVQVRGQST